MSNLLDKSSNGRGFASVFAFVLIMPGMLWAQAGHAQQPPRNPVHEGLVMLDRFDQVQGNRTLASLPNQDKPLVGKMGGGAKAVSTETGKGISLPQEGWLSYPSPTMLDLAQGALAMDVSLNTDLDSDSLRPIVVLWTLRDYKGQRRYMVRLYLLTKRHHLVFGVYDRTNRTWIMLLKTQVNWKRGEPHRVVVNWRDKASVFIDGQLDAVGVCEGLVSRRFMRPPVDLREATLHIGARFANHNKASRFTVHRLAIYNHQLRTGEQLTIGSNEP